MSGDDHCRGTTRAGERCRSRILGTDGYCLRHSPDPIQKELAKTSSMRGAATTRARQRRGLHDDELPPLDSPQAAEQWAEVIGRATATGRLSSSAAQAAMRAVSEWRAAHDAGALQERIARLQEQMAELKGGKK